jgi:hypothetical protein
VQVDPWKVGPEGRDVRGDTTYEHYPTLRRRIDTGLADGIDRDAVHAIAVEAVQWCRRHKRKGRAELAAALVRQGRAAQLTSIMTRGGRILPEYHACLEEAVGLQRATDPFGDDAAATLAVFAGIALSETPVRAETVGLLRDQVHVLRWRVLNRHPGADPPALAHAQRQLADQLYRIGLAAGESYLESLRTWSDHPEHPEAADAWFMWGQYCEWRNAFRTGASWASLRAARGESRSSASRIGASWASCRAAIIAGTGTWAARATSAITSASACSATPPISSRCRSSAEPSPRGRPNRAAYGPMRVASAPGSICRVRTASARTPAT